MHTNLYFEFHDLDLVNSLDVGRRKNVEGPRRVRFKAIFGAAEQAKLVLISTNYLSGGFSCLICNKNRGLTHPILTKWESHLL
jgi:hypothetical protein